MPRRPRALLRRQDPTLGGVYGDVLAFFEFFAGVLGLEDGGDTVLAAGEHGVLEEDALVQDDGGDGGEDGGPERAGVVGDEDVAGLHVGDEGVLVREADAAGGDAGGAGLAGSKDVVGRRGFFGFVLFGLEGLGFLLFRRRRRAEGRWWRERLVPAVERLAGEDELLPVGAFGLSRCDVGRRGAARRGVRSGGCRRGAGRVSVGRAVGRGLGRGSSSGACIGRHVQAAEGGG